MIATLRIASALLFLGGTTIEASPALLEAEALIVGGCTPGTVHRVFGSGDANLSGGQATILEASRAGDFVTYSVDVPRAGNCTVSIGVKTGANRGIVELSIDGQKIGTPQDLYSASLAYTELTVGEHAFSAAGKSAFTFAITGKSDLSTAFWVGLDYIKLDFTGDDTSSTKGEDGYDLWLRYQMVTDTTLLRRYREQVTDVVVQGSSPTINASAKELSRALSGLLGKTFSVRDSISLDGTVIAGTPRSSALIAEAGLSGVLSTLGNEGYAIRTQTLGSRRCIIIAGNSDLGVLYGVFAFVRLLQSNQSLEDLGVTHKPRFALRLLNHWDNLDGSSIERGYAGQSLWQWDQLPDSLDPRYTDYGRANASIGINGSVLNNVNSDPAILTSVYLSKVAALANVWRPFGIRVYLCPQFSAPKTLGGLSTADPLDPQVIAWWKAKADEIYALIPDFGGFLVKANSEGQPGPHDYGRSHAEGANCLARALAPHQGLVMWRAFVYGNSGSDDRVMQAYEAFKPLDGQFDTNVVVQVKNGPLDFQPREPVHPLFGAMPHTGLAMELQITQEYLGQGTHLVYLAPMWKEVLDFDTHAEGAQSTVSRIVDGTLTGSRYSIIAGVANTGDARKWCALHFAQANWYAFGRLAWDPQLSSEQIAEEWSRMTFTNAPSAVNTITGMLADSYEAYVNYTMPLGLNHIMARDHFNPSPATRQEYHKADATGIGYNRTSSGSGGVNQYFSPNRETFDNPATCPEKYLLWFHHRRYNDTISSGETVLQALFDRYDSYYPNVMSLITRWGSLDGAIDRRRFLEVNEKLHEQLVHARKWRDTCVTYFSAVSGQPYTPTGIIPDRQDSPGLKSGVIYTVQPNTLCLVFAFEAATPKRLIGVELFDLRGRLVRSHLQHVNASGTFRIALGTRDLARGSYITRISIDGKILETRRVNFVYSGTR